MDPGASAGPAPSHCSAVTDQQATSEALANKTVFTRWGEGERDLWNLNVGESLVFYSSLLVKLKKKTIRFTELE